MHRLTLINHTTMKKLNLNLSNVLESCMLSTNEKRSIKGGKLPIEVLPPKSPGCYCINGVLVAVGPGIVCPAVLCPITK